MQVTHSQPHIHTRAGWTAQWLSTLRLLQRALLPISSTYLLLTAFYNCSSRGSDALLWPLWVPVMHAVDRHAGRQTVYPIDVGQAPYKQVIHFRVMIYSMCCCKIGKCDTVFYLLRITWVAEQELWILKIIPRVVGLLRWLSTHSASVRSEFRSPAHWEDWEWWHGWEPQGWRAEMGIS